MYMESKNTRIIQHLKDKIRDFMMGKEQGGNGSSEEIHDPFKFTVGLDKLYSGTLNGGLLSQQANLEELNGSARLQLLKSATCLVAQLDQAQCMTGSLGLSEQSKPSNEGSLNEISGGKDEEKRANEGRRRKRESFEKDKSVLETSDMTERQMLANQIIDSWGQQGFTNTQKEMMIFSLLRGGGSGIDLDLGDESRLESELQKALVDQERQEGFKGEREKRQNQVLPLEKGNRFLLNEGSRLSFGLTNISKGKNWNGSESSDKMNTKFRIRIEEGCGEQFTERLAEGEFITERVNHDEFLRGPGNIDISVVIPFESSEESPKISEFILSSGKDKKKKKIECKGKHLGLLDFNQENSHPNKSDGVENLSSFCLIHEQPKNEMNEFRLPQARKKNPLNDNSSIQEKNNSKSGLSVSGFQPLSNRGSIPRLDFSKISISGESFEKKVVNVSHEQKARAKTQEPKRKELHEINENSSCPKGKNGCELIQIKLRDSPSEKENTGKIWKRNMKNYCPKRKREISYNEDFKCIELIHKKKEVKVEKELKRKSHVPNNSWRRNQYRFVKEKN